VKTLYKAANRIACALRLRRLESWSYMKWFRWWMRKDPAMGYWRFSAEYLGTGEIPAGAGA